MSNCVLDTTCCVNVLILNTMSCHFSKATPERSPTISLHKSAQLHRQCLQPAPCTKSLILWVFSLLHLKTLAKASTTMPRWRQRRVVNADLLFRLLHMDKLNADMFCSQISAWSTAKKHSFHIRKESDPWWLHKTAKKATTCHFGVPIWNCSPATAGLPYNGLAYWSVVFHQSHYKCLFRTNRRA